MRICRITLGGKDDHYFLLRYRYGENLEGLYTEGYGDEAIIETPYVTKYWFQVVLHKLRSISPTIRDLRLLKSPLRSGIYMHLSHHRN